MPGNMTVSLRINADGSAAITSLKQVEGAVTGLGKAGTQSASGIKQTETALDGVAKRSHEASYGVSNLTKSLQGMAITAGAAVSVAALARSFIQANIESQRLSKGLEAITGSTGAGAAELRYLQETADKLGLSLAAVSPAFISLSAATRGTVLEGQATKDIFEAVSLAMAKLGKSSADTQGALLAIEQMVSKGVVSAEELRGQLGERLPGAFRLAAQAMGVSEQELGKMLEKGDVLAADLIPRLVQWLNKLFNDGKEIGGLEAGWNLLVNALDRAWVSTDKLINASGLLSDAMRIAADVLNSYANALEAISNYNAGLGFRTFADDVAKFGVTLQASNQALKDYVAAREHADNVKNFTAFGVADDAAANADAALKKFQELRVAAYELKKALDEADAAKQRQAQSLAVSVGDDAIRLYRAHEAAVKANGEALDGLNGKYDKSIARAAEYKKMEEAVAEAVKLGTMTKEEGKAALEKFAAAQDKAAEAAGRHAGALSQEAQTVAAMEQKYGLMKGQLDAIWKLESNRGAGAGVESSRWVADLAAGSGHMTKIVGEFQMAEGTAKSLGADMRTFSGQADAAAKYLAQAAAKGKTLWEQFAYYHGGPNEAAWGEKTRAYADAAVKIVADATGTMQDLGQNTGKVITDTLNQAIRTVESLVQRYLPARYAAEEYAKAQQALAIASDAAGLSQEEQATILRGLQNDLQNSKTKATETADAWAEVWKNTVKRIDDTFAGLWKDLFSGTKSTMESLKDLITSWLAEVAHALLTKPLVVALTTSLTGTAGAAGTAGTVAGTASNAASGWSGLSNIGSLFSTAWNLGSTFLEGVAAGVSSMFSGTAGTALSFAWAGATSGTASGIAAGIGVAMPYIAPLLAIAGFAISKFFADQEPRYGAWSATVGNNPRGLEDWENGPENYAKGGFGLTFGLSDNGSKNMDASEFKDTYQAFADITQMLADFFGKSLSAKIQAGLESAAFANWTHDGVMRLANNEDMASAFKGIIDMIADQAAVTGEHIGVAFEYALGDLTGTAEEMAAQVQVAMQAAAAYTLVAEAWNTHIGAALGLTGEFGADIRTLGGYVAAFANDGENAAQTLARLSAEIDALEYAASLTSTSLSGLSGTALVQMAESLADAFGNIDVASQALSFYAENFQTPGETFQRQARAAMEQIQRVWDNFDFEKLMPVIPTTRAEFTSLVNSLDLTSEAGRNLFAALMQLGPAFDGLFDAQEAFRDWIAPVDPVTGAMERIGKLFESWGIQLPKDRDGLEALYRSGALTTEQMAILGAYLDDLRIIFDQVGEGIADLTDLHIRLAQALGDDALALRLQREKELSSAANDAARALLMMIYAAEDLGKSPNKYNYGIRDARDPRLTGGQYNTEILIALSKLIGANYKMFDNGTGTIKGDELRGLLKDIAGPDEIDRLIQALDTNGDGTIGELERLPLLIAANLGPLFDQFDTNKSGGLDFEELKKVLGGTLDDAQLKAIFALLDINGDGMISKLEATNLQQIAAINGQKDAVVGKLGDVVGAVNDAATKIIGALGILGDRLLGANTKEVSVKSALDSEAIITAKQLEELSTGNLSTVGTEGQANILDLLNELDSALTGGEGPNGLNMDELLNGIEDVALTSDQWANLLETVGIDDEGIISATGVAAATQAAAIGISTTGIVNAINDLGLKFPGINIDKSALLPPPNLIRDEAGDSASLRAALADLQSEIAALRAGTEKAAQANERGSTALQGAAEKLHNAATAIPERLEVVVPSLYSEAGF